MLQVKEKDLVDTIGRGVKTKVCKLCGLVIGDLAQHVIWHNRSGM